MKKFWKEWKNTIFIGAGIFILALVLRLYNLTLLPVFGDEAIYIRWSQIMSAEPGLRFVPLSDGKQPLFMWVLMFLVRRFADPLFIGRLTSVFYGTGTLVGIFAVAYVLFWSPPSREASEGHGKKIALIASFLWAVSPYSVFFDRMALVDSQLAMFGIWTLLFGVITAKTLRLDTAMLAGFALGGALLTKSPAIFFLVLLPSTWIVSTWPKRKKGQAVGKKELISPFAKRFGGSSGAFSRGGYLIKLSSLFAVTLLIGYGIYNILRLGENFHLISSRNQDYLYPINHLWTDPARPFIDNLNGIYNWLWILGPSVLVIFFALSLIDNIKIAYFKLKKKPKPEAALLFIWSTFPLIVQAMYARVFTARYIFFALPSIYIFASIIFVYLSSKREILKKVLVFGLLVYIGQALGADYRLLTDPTKASLPRVMRSGYLEEWTAGTGIREISVIIRNEYLRNPQQKIVAGTEGYFGTLPDGLQIYLNDLPEITVIGVGIDLKEVPVPLVESKKAGNKTYLVINSTRLKADPSELGLELLAVYPKAFRPDGSRESLYFFEVVEAALLQD